MQDWVGYWRKDRRCGLEFPLPDGSGQPGQCNPDSENFCCSKSDLHYCAVQCTLLFRWGFCGGDEEHCGCAECVNYRNS